MDLLSPMSKQIHCDQWVCSFHGFNINAVVFSSLSTLFNTNIYFIIQISMRTTPDFLMAPCVIYSFDWIHLHRNQVGKCLVGLWVQGQTSILFQDGWREIHQYTQPVKKTIKKWPIFITDCQKVHAKTKVSFLFSNGNFTWIRKPWWQLGLFLFNQIKNVLAAATCTMAKV